MVHRELQARHTPADAPNTSTGPPNRRLIAVAYESASPEIVVPAAGSNGIHRG